MFGDIAENVKMESLISRIWKKWFLNLYRQQCVCTVKLITEL